MASVESAKALIWWVSCQMDAPGMKSDAIPAIRVSRGGRYVGGNAHGDTSGRGGGGACGDGRVAARTEAGTAARAEAGAGAAACADCRRS
jgi:hypothetical protein